ncbi:hypothetical protein BU24DRAFT_489315 [Aaosphaeria arxii CBS 175.79]|uniref:BZIP domain-containing protein n=1 Tax=Aaosphaeria arxii CBS 175.79 TaxID=1450172 RepID=A0A6A5Y2R7_9PLEO|nr:uncharacterized protein BU24DRAFT_489315 [Aaosphaeria arxii CBS 175.79]KAF2019327.1 hypothetical protein BU24DRAFT_489315 [Aaosphaeria arxii CBS 175.79]
MDSQSFDYWLAQGNYVPPQHPSQIYEIPPPLSKVPSLSGSPVSSTYDQFPTPPVPQQHQQPPPQQQPPHYYPQIADDSMYAQYPLPMTPSDFGSDHDSAYCSPHQSHVDHLYVQGASSAPAERTHTTSGRRRAQNRAAQRAFRERKEKHARDLEAQLAVLTDKYNKLEGSHTELNAAYEKLRKTIELLTQDDDAEGEEEEAGNKSVWRRSSNSETLRKLLEILHGEFKGVAVKNESA